MPTSLKGKYRKVNYFEDFNFGWSLPQSTINHLVTVFCVSGIVLFFVICIMQSFVSAVQLEFHLNRKHPEYTWSSE